MPPLLYRFLITVIIPIFNTGPYLTKTIDSVISQTIGFQENIQIILVNDGSTDNTESICLQYQEKYPSNIIYIKQDNMGASAARNRGLEYAEGKYINFLDSDDRWRPTAFKRLYTFFEQHYDEVDVVGARMFLFDGEAGYHILDYKFRKTKVVDLRTEWSFIQLHASSSFIKTAAIQTKRFDPAIKYGEDGHFINTIILSKCKYGIVRNAVHWYRKRTANDSMMQTKTNDLNYYFDSLKHFYLDLFNRSYQLYGEYLKFIQYIFMYDFQWRIQQHYVESHCLSPDYFDLYYNNLTMQLRLVDSDVITSQRHMTRKQKLLCIWKNAHPSTQPDLLYEYFLEQ